MSSSSRSGGRHRKRNVAWEVYKCARKIGNLETCGLNSTMALTQKEKRKRKAKWKATLHSGQGKEAQAQVDTWIEEAKQEFRELQEERKRRKAFTGRKHLRKALERSHAAVVKKMKNKEGKGKSLARALEAFENMESEAMYTWMEGEEELARDKVLEEVLRGARKGHAVQADEEAMVWMKRMVKEWLKRKEVQEKWEEWREIAQIEVMDVQRYLEEQANKRTPESDSEDDESDDESGDDGKMRRGGAVTSRTAYAMSDFDDDEGEEEENEDGEDGGWNSAEEDGWNSADEDGWGEEETQDTGAGGHSLFIGSLGGGMKEEEGKRSTTKRASKDKKDKKDKKGQKEKGKAKAKAKGADEKAQPTPKKKKNRMGQRQRRQLAEQKFGEDAKHLAVHPSWKAKRQAVEEQGVVVEFKGKRKTFADGEEEAEGHRTGEDKEARAQREMAERKRQRIERQASKAQDQSAGSTGGGGNKHPSWQAKERERALIAKGGQGSRVVFGDDDDSD